VPINLLGRGPIRPSDRRFILRARVVLIKYRQVSVHSHLSHLVYDVRHANEQRSVAPPTMSISGQQLDACWARSPDLCARQRRYWRHYMASPIAVLGIGICPGL